MTSRYKPINLLLFSSSKIGFFYWNVNYHQLKTQGPNNRTEFSYFWTKFNFFHHLLYLKGNKYLSLFGPYQSLSLYLNIIFFPNPLKRPENSNSNWTFIALNLPKQEDSKAQQNKSSQQNSVSRDITGVEHHGERQEDDSG